MKKLYFLLVLFGIILSSETAVAQIRYDTHIEFKDSQGNNFFPIPQVVIRHTDSASHTTSPILYFMGKHESSYGYQDSFLLDSSMQDTAFTVNYFACGQWYSLDTSYTKEHPNGRSRKLDIMLTLPCIRPCDAGFFLSDHFLVNTNTYVFSAGQQGGSTQHEWDLGNGVHSFSPVISTKYDTVGTVTVKHILRDTVRGCIDSSFQTYQFSPTCYAGFSSKEKSAYLHQFTAYNQNPSYSNYWYVDSVLVDSGLVLNYMFNSSGSHTVQQINFYGTYCSISSTKTVNVNSGPCYIGMTISKNGREVTFTPEFLNVPYFYKFGDGDTGTYTGQVTHIYPLTSSTAMYYMRVRDVYLLCNERSMNVLVPVACNAPFSINNPSSFTLTVSNSTNANFTSRYRLSTGDSIIGNSGSFQINTPGQYTLTHDFYGQSGITQCMESKYIWVSNCGQISDSPLNYRVVGQVSFNGQRSTNYDSLQVYFIKYDSATGSLTAIDSVVLYSAQNDTAFFAFILPCDSSPAEYLFKAALLPGSSIYSNYLPSYSINSTSWSNAQHFTAPSFAAINMVAGNNPGGPGFIGGLISQGANKKFKPLSGVQVNLFTEQGDPVAYTYSDQNGAYSFVDIAYGKYQVVVEELGKVSASYWITLDATLPKAEERNFEVNSSYVSILGTGFKEDISLSQNVFPNPAHDRLTIEWSDAHSSSYNISFYAIDGRLLKSELVQPGSSSQTELDISTLPRGLTMMLIQDGNTTQLIKVQIH